MLHPIVEGLFLFYSEDSFELFDVSQFLPNREENSISASSFLSRL